MNIKSLQMKSKISVLFLFTVLFSCGKKSSIKEILVVRSNENCVYSSTYVNNFTYYKFDQLYKKKLNNSTLYDYCDKGNIIEVAKKHSISRDNGSRVHRLVYAVIDYNEEMFVLHCKRKLNRNHNMDILTIRKANYQQKRSGFYLERRINHPE